MTRSRHSRSVVRLLGLTLVVVGAVACRDMLVTPASKPGSLALSYQLSPRFAQVATNSGAAFDKADRVWVRLSRGQRTVLDTLIPFTPGPEVRVGLELPTGQSSETLHLAFELRRGSSALFVGSQEVAVQAGTTTGAQVGLMPVPAAVQVPDSTRVNAIGDTVQLSGSALFATNDVIPNAVLTWTTSDTAVVSVTPGGRLISRRNGEARVIARADAAGTRSDTITVRVRQVLAEIRLRSDTVPMQEKITISAAPVDSNGVATDPSVTPALSWSSSDSRIARVDSTGAVQGVMLGEATVSVKAGGVTGTVPVRVSPLVHRSLATGQAHTCALDAAGKGFCWGDNTSGQLGLPGNTYSSSATPSAITGGLSLFMISAGGLATCGLVTDGTAYCWGSNSQGQLGNGDLIPHFSPVAVLGDLKFASITVGYQHACGLTSSGNTYCWGSNSRGQLGNGTTTGSPTPVAVAGGLAFRSITAGLAHTCGLTSDGEAYCWGWNSTFGSLGDGTFTDRHTPTPVVGGHRFTELTAGAVNTCGITTSGSTYCWGDNRYGTLGTGTAGGRSSSPVLVAGGHAFVSLALSRENSLLSNSICGTTADGTTYCWGSNYTYQLAAGVDEVCGSGFLRSPCSTTPVPMSGGIRFRSVQLGMHRACGIAVGGELHCWGSKGVGELGDGSIGLALTPVKVSGNASFQSVSAANWGGHACAVAQDGITRCWGNNINGQLGTGTNANSAVPVAVAGGTAFSSIDAGTHFTCALTGSGAAHCWGLNNFGQLGNGTTASSNTPTPVSGGLTLRTISSTMEYTDAVTTDGARYWWGRGGSGDAMVNSSPVSGGTAFTIQSNAAGAFHTCVLTPGGEAYCRGANTNGQLGNGTTTSSTTMVPVSGGHVFQSLTAGHSHTCGLTTAGQAYCWGLGSSGRLGNGADQTSSTPVLVAGGLTFSSLSAGDSHTCGTTTAGTAYCWGSNGAGEIGNGSRTMSNAPVAVSGGLTFRSLSAGGGFTCGVTTGGAAYCWGDRGAGQLGDGVVGFVTTPVRVSGPLRIATLSTPTSPRVSLSMSPVGRNRVPVTTPRTARASRTTGERTPPCGPGSAQLMCDSR